MLPARIREARLGAGLTLQQLAGTELTKQHLSLVERGRSRPSLWVMRLIAERTGKPVDHFLSGPMPPEAIPMELEAELAELQRLDNFERFDEVIERGAALLAGPLPPAARARVQLLLGRAHVRLLQPEHALEHLRSARAALHQQGDPWLEAECMNYEAGALHLKEEPGAVGLCREAIVLCRRLDPVPVHTELRLLVNLASFHARRHEWAEAVTAGQEAISCADAVHDLGRMARLQHSLAIAYRNLGETGRALACAQKALALQEFEGDGGQKGRVENTLGLLLLQRGDLEGAERTLLNSLDSLEGTRAEGSRSHVVMSLAEVHLARGEDVLAEAGLRDALSKFEARGERMSAALAWQLLGKSLEGQGRHTEADEAFRTGIRQLESEGVPKRLVEAHAAYAEVLDQRGDVHGAKDHWRLAVLAGRPELGTQRAAPGRLERAAGA